MTASVPDFTLTDQAGEPWTLAEARRQGAVVLVLYRGDW
jgi:peroxiredoxin